MIMIQMAGGLGNQMFYYALYRAFAERGCDVCIEDFTHYEEIGRYDNNLEKIFPLTYRKTTRAEYNRLTDSSLLPWKRIKRKVFGRKQKIYKEKDAITYEADVFFLKDSCLEGYWQSERYFENIKALIRKDFSFDWKQFSEKACLMKKRMEESLSVSIHVRRGDYLRDEFKDIYGGICTEAYYQSARSYLQEKFGQCTFFLFTNDPEWGRQQKDVILVDCAEPGNDYVDMALMSCCRHHIIANSSFSWWGAWLDPHEDKTVVAPARWLNGSHGQDIYAGLCNVLIDAAGQVERESVE